MRKIVRKVVYRLELLLDQPTFTLIAWLEYFRHFKTRLWIFHSLGDFLLLCFVVSFSLVHQRKVRTAYALKAWKSRENLWVTHSFDISNSWWWLNIRLMFQTFIFLVFPHRLDQSNFEGFSRSDVGIKTLFSCVLCFRAKDEAWSLKEFGSHYSRN